MKGYKVEFLSKEKSETGLKITHAGVSRIGPNYTTLKDGSFDRLLTKENLHWPDLIYQAML